MAYAAKILADSLSPLGDRLTTFEITFPRIVLAEFNTHRMLSRNSASSRAIPVRQMLERVLNDPFVPVYWGKNQAGMSAHDELSLDCQREATIIWQEAMADSIYRVIELQIGAKMTVDLLDITFGHNNWSDVFPTVKIAILHKMVEGLSRDLLSSDEALGVHKQIANRLLEPWMWHTVIVTATEWSNFFALRTEASAQPEIQRIAQMMHQLYHQNRPEQLGPHDWHLPLVYKDEFDNLTSIEKAMICTGRCCRVSYLTHEGKRDPDRDVALHNSLLNNGHMSPFEHAARPMDESEKAASCWSGNFYGWIQYRKMLEYESDFSQARKNLEGSAWCEDCLAVHATRQYVNLFR